MEDMEHLSKDRTVFESISHVIGGFKNILSKQKKSCSTFFVRISFAHRLAGGVSFALPNNPPSYLHKRVRDTHDSLC